MFIFEVAIEYSSYYSLSRRITEDSGRHITVRQLESTVRLAQGILLFRE